MRLLFAIVFVILSSGCTFTPKNPSQYKLDAEEHLIRINRHGYLIASDFASQSALKRDSLLPLSSKVADDKFNLIILQTLTLACQKKQMNNTKQCVEQMSAYIKGESTINALENSPIKVMVYFHGGLNTYANSDERMEKQLQLIEGERHDWHYPIFVSWPSNAPGTLSEHWFSIREGRSTPKYIGYPTAPFIIFEDLVTSIAEFPSNLYYQFTNDKDRFMSGTNFGLSSIWNEAEYQYEKETGSGDLNSWQADYRKIGENIHVNRSIYSRSGLMPYIEGSALTLLSPIRYTIGSAWNGALANNAWDVMKRRARNMFYPAGDFDKRFNDEDSKGNKLAGAHLGLFFEKLLMFQEKHPELNIDLTLIGHSMGTIAINNLLGKYQRQWENTPMLKNIVYMAAAASIEDTLAIVPDILRNNKNNISFYNLTLNRVAEVAETYAKGLLPSGSLLVSIDKYHDTPEHHLKRTFGSEVNIHSSLPTIVGAFGKLEDKVTFKAFDKINNELPTKHGDFGCLPYWQKQIWSIEEDPTIRETSHRIDVCN